MNNTLHHEIVMNSALITLTNYFLSLKVTLVPYVCIRRLFEGEKFYNHKGHPLGLGHLNVQRGDRLNA